MKPQDERANVPMEYDVIGTRPLRADAADKLTGRAVFGPDVALPGLIHGKMLRSPHAHARIRSINMRRAEAYPGIYAVVTTQDLSPVPGQSATPFDSTLASRKALYQGHPIAAVAASSPHIAEEALALIEVDYEVLPPVLDVREAMHADAPLLHEHMVTRSLSELGRRPSNIASHFQHLKGDPAKGFAQADVVVEREFTTVTVHQGYIEPHAATAQWSADGSLTVWSTTQGAFAVRDYLVELLSLPMSQVRVIPTEVGGAFGGKATFYLEAVAALLAHKAGRPVKMGMSRAEVLMASGPTSGSYMKVKVGATRDGKLTAAQAELCFEAGAYPGSPVGSAAGTMFAPYDIPNGQIDGYDVVVNKPRVGSYRGPGAPQGNFAAEQVIDELAEKLGIDPLKFRLQNVVREGTECLDGSVHGNIGAEQVLLAARACPHYSAPLGGPCRGRGVAQGYWGNWGARSSCIITVNGDGTVSLVSGSVDLSGTRTSVAMQAAEVLGLPVEKIKSSVADTDSIGYSEVSGGSRTTFATGIAAVEAARDVIAQLCARAAILWDVKSQAVTFAGGVFRTQQGGLREMSFDELAIQLSETGGAVMGRGNVDAQGWGGAFGTHIADVEVDPETGKVTVLRYTVVQDVGKAIHPSLVEGQMQGGAVQGIGWALYEGYQYDAQGHMLNPGFLDYKMPTALDVPMIETVIVEVPGPNHPYGVRGVGEVPIVPPLAAIANAIYHATGKRITQLPMTPTRILESLGVI
jgi:xanthine dehydrogenase molybdenum-binding subunit